MIGFEIFDIKSWNEQGLSKHFAAKRKTDIPLRKKAWKAALLVSLAACSMTVLESNLENTQLSINWGAPLKPLMEATVHLDGEVPVGYWPKLMKTINGWEPLDEVTLTEPDPIV